MWDCLSFRPQEVWYATQSPAADHVPDPTTLAPGHAGWCGRADCLAAGLAAVGLVVAGAAVVGAVAPAPVAAMAPAARAAVAAAMVSLVFMVCLLRLTSRTIANGLSGNAQGKVRSW